MSDNFFDLKLRPDETEDMIIGRQMQLYNCEAQARILMFGAIRRAAEVARHWQNDQEEICGEAAAFYIRQAIRAAIGSAEA